MDTKQFYRGMVGVSRMPSKNWNQWYVLCPFYKNDDGRRTIQCEGICDSCKIQLVFDTRADCLIQIATFCKADFMKCEIYRAALMKYEDDVSTTKSPQTDSKTGKKT